MYQAAVGQFGWLTSAQMIDGLALGETTPGPLIIVVAFVGFIGGSTHPAFGAVHWFYSGAVGALTAAWFTFLPSFIFILAGGPLVERTQHNLKLTAPLTGITAAVVGVISNLALLFAYHVFWPAGFSGKIDWVSALIALGAAIALLHFKVNVMIAIAACAVIGFGMTLSGLIVI